MIEIEWRAKAPKSFDVDGFFARFPALAPEIVSYVGEHEELDTKPAEAGFRGAIGEAQDAGDAVAMALRWLEANLAATRALVDGRGEMFVDFHGGTIRQLRPLSEALSAPATEARLKHLQAECMLSFPIPTKQEVEEVFGPELAAEEAESGE